MGDALETRVMSKVSWRIIPFIVIPHAATIRDRVSVGLVAMTLAISRFGPRRTTDTTAGVGR